MGSSQPSPYPPQNAGYSGYGQPGYPQPGYNQVGSNLPPPPRQPMGPMPYSYKTISGTCYTFQPGTQPFASASTIPPQGSIPGGMPSNTYGY